MAEYVINIYKQQFTQADVLKAVNAPFRKVGEEGLSAMTLNNWIKREHLPKLSEHSPGSGRRRLFSAKDAVQIAALMHMTHLNISLSNASAFLYFFRDYMDLQILPGSLKENMGELLLFMMAKPNGELLVKPVYERDATGKPNDISYLEELPGFITINVDFIMRLVNGELSKILEESGEAENQDDDGVTLRRETRKFWQRLFSESVIELEELETKLKSENREPTDEERTRLSELRQNIEDGKLILKSRRGKEKTEEETEE